MHLFLYFIHVSISQLNITIGIIGMVVCTGGEHELLASDPMGFMRSGKSIFPSTTIIVLRLNFKYAFLCFLLK